MKHFLVVFVFVTSLTLIVRDFLSKHKQKDKNHNNYAGILESMEAIRSLYMTSNSSARWAQLYLAGFFILASVSQLFAFEDYPDLITSYGLPFFNGGVSAVVAVFIVAVEIAAIPSLLGMRLSWRSLRISFVASWTALMYWLLIGLWQSLTSETITNAGLFGSKIVLPQGWWLVSLMLALIVLYGFSSWCGTRKK